MKYFIVLGALAAYISVASAARAYIKSFCKFPVYMHAIDAQRKDTRHSKILNYGDEYSEPYHTPSFGGVSLKLSKTPALVDGTYTQFEYTLIGGQIWYDGSNVNCPTASMCPFYETGVYLEASIPSCPVRTCPLNQPCTGFYILYNDDINTLSCDPSADIRMYLCTTSPNGPSNAGGNIESATSSALSLPSTSIAPAVKAPSPIPSPKVSVVVNAVVPSSTVIATVSSNAPVYRMEAIQIASRDLKAKRRALNSHNHMRRHERR